MTLMRKSCNKRWPIGAVCAPRHYRARERKLHRAQRHLSRARQGSRNRQKARRRVAQMQERTANLRQEFLHQLFECLISLSKRGR